MHREWKKRTAIFLTSQTISIFGSNIVSNAIIWYITLKTSSASVMTISILCTFIPQIIISLFAGVWADRYNRKLIIMFSDLFTALVTLIAVILMFNGITSLYLLFAISALRALGSGVQSPAVSAVIPQIVPVENLSKVNGIYQTVTSVMMLISPAVGGLILSTMGFKYALLVDVVTALGAVFVMMFLRIDKVKAGLETESMIKQIKSGIGYIRNNNCIAKLLIAYGLFFLLVTPVVFLSPVMITRKFGENVWLLSANEMAWTGGSVIGGIFMSVLGDKFVDRIKIMAISAAGIGITIALLGFMGKFSLYILVMVIQGLFVPVFNTAQAVFFQENISEDMMGRIFSIIQIITVTVMPIGMIGYGPLGDVVSIESILIVTGALMAMLSFFIKRIKINAN